MQIITSPKEPAMDPKPNKGRTGQTLILMILTAFGMFTLMREHYKPMVGELESRIAAYEIKSREQHYDIYTRKAICMEDRTTRFIVAPKEYALHDCVWVNDRGIVCDTCSDAMMYMLLEGPRKDSIVLSSK